MNAKFTEWCRALQSIAQSGLIYSRDPFDIERFQQLRTLVGEMLSSDGEPADAEAVQSLLDAEQGYLTPKVDVRGAVFRDDRILLVREHSDGLWSLPGGWADVNDSPGDSVVREIREESGFATRCVKLVALYDRDRHHHPPMYLHVYKIFFLCELLGGSPSPSLETDDIGFFAETELPPLSTARVTSKQIATMFAHHRNRNLPTAFD